MSEKCIKCKHLVLSRGKYPCNSCKELDCYNRLISHFDSKDKIDTCNTYNILNNKRFNELLNVEVRKV